ncbi:hypothetical protein PV518_28295, partial [Streptomyces sp. ND04-05B]|nr:hypothetical protein [Streptomyces sp. ND04-05B]
MTTTETEITEDLVRDLLREQHPDLADRPVKLGARGWDNQVWRLGDDLAVRLPWATRSADELLRKERRGVEERRPKADDTRGAVLERPRAGTPGGVIRGGGGTGVGGEGGEHIVGAGG